MKVGKGEDNRVGINGYSKVEVLLQVQLILSYCSLTKCSSLRTSNSFVVSVVNASSKTKLISETFGGAVFKLFQKNKV